MKATIYKNCLSDAEAEHYERMNPGWQVVNRDILCFVTNDGVSRDYVIFSGPWTRTEMCRDCGDHYIIALHQGFIRVSKGNLRISLSATDE